MKNEIIELLEKRIKTCHDCNEEFLGLALTTGKEDGNYRIDYIGVNDYPLRCNKCPACAMKCFEKMYNKAKEEEDSPIEIECEKDFYIGDNPDCYNSFFDDFDESHFWVERDYQYRSDLIDLFDELKNLEDK
ncbi:MAG: hypothetical protein ACFFCV_18825 [Promethearchaeota archaeon]